MSVDEDHYEYSSPLPSSPDHVQESANYRPLPKPPPISPRQPVPVPATAAASEAVTNGARTSNGDRLKRYSDIPHRSSNEVLKTHTNFAVRLSETGTYGLDGFLVWVFVVCCKKQCFCVLVYTIIV